MRKLRKFLSIILVLGIAVSLVACGGDSTSGDTVSFYVGVDTYNVNAYKTLVDTYNAGQGKKDGVVVKLNMKASGYDADLSTVLAGNSPDILTISDKYFKNYAISGGLYNIQTLLDDESLTTYNDSGEKNFDISKVYPDLVNRFRIDLTSNQAGYEDNPLYAMPNGSNATFLIYNIDAFENAGINIISKDEDELSGTNFAVSGYSEYVTAPESGLTASINIDGETVYKVFNNQIPMSWSELERISKYLTKSYTSTSITKYGFLSDWWFPFGWSVGGDCMNWDEEKNQYVFTLGNDDKNYIVTTDNYQVNGTTYNSGDILSYKDRTYVANNTESFSSDIGNNLYTLPSQYDAFEEYCKLSKVKTKQGIEGYSISPTYKELTSVGTKTQFFTSKNVAILAEGYNILNNLSKNTVGENLINWDVCPCWQYKLYEGAEDGEFKVIGKKYEGTTFEGKILTVNGTEIKGKQASSSENSAFVIAKNAKNPESAFKFLQWASGLEGQKIISSGNFSIPNQIEYAESEEYLNGNRLCNNMSIISKALRYETIGDWSYVENGQWVSHWANILNGPVRNGEMTLSDFFYGKENKVESTANDNLSLYKVRIYGK